MIENQVRRVPYGVWVEEAGVGIPSFYLAHGLGPDGLRLRAKHPPRPGSALQLRLVVENERRVVSLQGEVVEPMEEEEGFAVRFTALDDDEQAFLEELMLESSFDD
jgi:hypothetical protein